MSSQDHLERLPTNMYPDDFTQLNEKFIKARRDYEALLESSMSHPPQHSYTQYAMRPAIPGQGYPQAPGGYPQQAPPQSEPQRFYTPQPGPGAQPQGQILKLIRPSLNMSANEVFRPSSISAIFTTSQLSRSKSSVFCSLLCSRSRGSLNSRQCTPASTSRSTVWW